MNKWEPKDEMINEYLDHGNLEYYNEEHEQASGIMNNSFLQ